MRIVIQRVSQAQVEIDGHTVARIGIGLVLLVGIMRGDSLVDASYLAEKCVNLRIFEDDAGKMNISGLEMNAELLVISQFTLYGDTRHGRRPSFIDAAPPTESLPIFDQFVSLLQQSGLKVATGRFGAHMNIELVNDGPVTIILDSRER